MNRDVTIITVSKRNPHGLERTLKSIVLLKEVDFRVLVVLASEDSEELEIIRRFKVKHIGFPMTLVIQKSKGIYRAMNEGLQSCDGQYVVFMNSGDEFADDLSLKSLLDAAMSKEVGFVLGGHAILNSIKKYTKKEKCLNERTFAFYLRSGCHQAILYNLSALNSIGGYSSDYELCADYLANLLMIRNYGGYRINRVVAIVDSGGISEIKWREVAMERHRIRVQFFGSAFISSASYILMLLTHCKRILRKPVKFS